MSNSQEYALVLGTHNAKKGRELAELLRPYSFRVSTLSDFPDALDVVEDGESFAENARKKAVEQAVHLRQWVLGEDSGLVVPALRGAPGIFSARFAGPNADDQQNNERLLSAMAELPDEARSAHYVCSVAVSDPEGEVRLTCEGDCHGRITRQPAGSGGFGYDPLFEIVEYHLTFGQLGDHVKGVLSHRSRAMRQLIGPLLQLATSGWTEGLSRRS